ncbi:uncharacterized protein DUF3810 [Maribacter vaceletii]|uniref:Uncharacterized protein DUF3810 n=1 Tax=Maribacter vaceletii TaxID=1206816 RepID=A0A495DSI2_9FLAO|nr:DUF3810 domain-containing protein [Maribacter vaceletii]RKR07109.1 uncharacterized protein DUF3810 [Maribacter vaceletii]
MKLTLNRSIALLLIPQIIAVKWLGSHPEIIEKYYSNWLYPILSSFFRTLFGWVPFSIGDIIYFSLLAIGLGYIYTNRKYLRKNLKVFFINCIMILSIVYFTFHLLWGLNYYREPIAKKFHLKEDYTQEELIVLTKKLIAKTNATQLQITKDATTPVTSPYTKEEIFSKTLEGYDQLNKKYPFLSYQKPSIKKSLFSTGLTYMGYGGYLNPFTNEAQVNALLPKFRFPVVAGHEIGHQIGYSAENETNFIGYLVTVRNSDIYFKYSAYAYALGYCLNDINKKDPELVKQLLDELNPGVRKNYKQMADFWDTYENPLEPIFKTIYNSFLKANNQTKGIQSYNAVVSLMISYHKKNNL